MGEGCEAARFIVTEGEPLRRRHVDDGGEDADTQCADDTEACGGRTRVYGCRYKIRGANDDEA